MVYTVEHFRSKINTNRQWLERAVLAIDRRQTDDEQSARTTKYRNKRGWNSADARDGTRIANTIRERTDSPEGFRLCFEDQRTARRILHKYAGQLVLVAKERASKAA